MEKNIFYQKHEEYLDLGYSKGEALIHAISHQFKIPLSDSHEGDYFSSIENEDLSNRFINIFLEATKLVPNKYKNFSYKLIITEEKNSFSIPENNTIVIKWKTDMISMMAEAFHEYLHLIELEHPKILQDSLSFLKKRSSGKMVSINSLYKKIGYPIVEEDMEVLETDLLDPYMGKIYPKGTEVLSMSGQVFLLNPFLFLEKDLEQHDFILNFFKN